MSENTMPEGVPRPRRQMSDEEYEALNAAESVPQPDAQPDVPGPSSEEQLMTLASFRTELNALLDGSGVAPKLAPEGVPAVPVPPEAPTPTDETSETSHEESAERPDDEPTIEFPAVTPDQSVANAPVTSEVKTAPARALIPETDSNEDTAKEDYLSDADEISPEHAAKLARPETLASKIAHWGGRGLSIVLIASVVLAAVLAIATRFIPTLWLVIGGIPVALIAGGITYGLFVTRPHIHRKTYAGLSIGAVIGVVLALFAATFLSRLADFTNTIQPPSGTAVTYAVIGLKANQLNPTPGSEFDPQVLAGSGVGQIGNDPNHDKVAIGFGERVTANLVDFSNPTELAVGLTNAEVIAGIVDSAVLSLFEEHSPEFYESFEILFTFDIYVEAKPPVGDPNDTAKPFVLFISGIDTWGDLGQTGRSDVNMLVIINPNTGKMLLVNTPRDYYVPLRGKPGLPDKLTHAGVYGVETSVGTIEDLYDVEVDYWLRINFNSVMSIVDSLGGVDIEVTDEFTCGWGYMDRQYTFYPGLQHLDGEQALCFARERKSLDGGDRARGKHQQLIIEGIMDKVTSASILLRYDDVLNALSPHLQTSMPASQIATFARVQFEHGISWDIDEVSVDGYDAYAATYTYGSQELYVMKPIISSVDEAKARITATLEGK